MKHKLIPAWVFGIAAVGLLVFGVIVPSIKNQNASLEKSRDNIQTAIVVANNAMTQQAQTIADSDRSINTMQAQGHDLCMAFLMTPVTNGAVVDVTRLIQCKEFVSDTEYEVALDHQVLRASGKLTVFLSENPFYVVKAGQNINATEQLDSTYALVFDVLDGVTEFAVGSCGEVTPSVPEGTFLIYPCDN